MKTIALAGGQSAMVDDADHDKLEHIRWRLHTSRTKHYAKSFQRGHTIYMHRLLMDAKYGELVDHRDGNGLNNQRGNLRIATHAQNNANRRAYPKARGITWLPGQQRWRAQIRKAGKLYRLGLHESEAAATAAYNAKAQQLFGEFAVMQPISPAPNDLPQPAIRLKKLRTVGGAIARLEEVDWYRADGHLWTSRPRKEGGWNITTKIGHQTVRLEWHIMSVVPHPTLSRKPKIEFANGDTLDFRRCNLIVKRRDTLKW